MTTDSSPASAPAENGSSLRYSRILTVPQLTAIGLSLGIGLGIYALLGTLTIHYRSQSIQASYLLLFIISVPIVLTLADLARMSGGNGTYGLVRTDRRLTLVFLTGWCLIGGYVTLLTLLGWGVSLHIDLMLRFADVTVPRRLLAGAVLLIMAIARVFGSQLGWRRRTLLVGGATLTALILAFSGLFFDPRAQDLTVFLTSDVRSINTSVMSMMALLAVTLWGVIMIVEMRGARHNAQRLRPAMGLTVIITAIVGGTGALAVDRHWGPFANPLTPLFDFAVEGIVFSPELFRILYLALGMVIMLIGLDLVFGASIRLVEEMAADGFVPQRVERSRGRKGTPLLPILGTTALALLLLAVIESNTLVGASAILLFWVLAALSLPALTDGSNSRYARRSKLPFHPIFPGLTVAIGVFAPLNLLGAPWLVPLIWLGGGLLLYFAFARQSGIAYRRGQLVGGEREDVIAKALAAPSRAYSLPPDADLTNSVLVAVGNPKSSENLIEAGLALAKVRGVSLIILRVLRLPEETALDIRRKLAANERDSLEEALAEVNTGATPVYPIVRLGVGPIDGILDVIQSMEVGLLLLGWSGKMASEEVVADPVVDPLLRAAPCDVMVLRGALPTEPERIVVATAGGPHATLAAELTHAVIDDSACHLRLLHVLPEESTTEEKQAGNALLTQLGEAIGEEDVEYQMMGAESIEQGIIEGAAGADLLVMGAAKTNTFTRSRFRGMPVRIAANMAGPVIIVRARETVRQPILSRSWELLSDPMPTLTDERRKEVALQMTESAEPSIDFYVLIILASIIASLGLLQNSAAVIIGAMLVAPLMSPILAMSMAIVRGNLAVLTTASEATAKGILLSIVVGVGVVLISPIDTPTTEILARTQPNVLDLMVALASGAAAGYAISRTKVAAALPGVAIAAALVPPLCVVGYGIGTSELGYAGGALLLFATNLVAIILSAAIVFLSLGFYPRDVDGRELWKRLRIPIISLAIISVVLAFATVTTVRDANHRAEVERILVEEVDSANADVQSLVIERNGREYTINVMLIVAEGYDIDPEDVEEIEKKLKAAVGADTRITATILRGDYYTESSYSLFQELEETMEEAIAAHGGTVRSLNVNEQRRDVLVTATVIDQQGDAFSSKVIESIRQELEETTQPRNVTLDLTVLYGAQTTVEPDGRD